MSKPSASVLGHLEQARLKHDWADALQVLLRHDLMGSAYEDVVRIEQALVSVESADNKNERKKFARLALQSSEALLKRDKKNIEALLLHGRAAAAAGKSAEAIKYFRRAHLPERSVPRRDEQLRAIEAHERVLALRCMATLARKAGNEALAKDCYTSILLTATAHSGSLAQMVSSDARVQPLLEEALFAAPPLESDAARRVEALRCALAAPLRLTHATSRQRAHHLTLLAQTLLRRRCGAAYAPIDSFSLVSKVGASAATARRYVPRDAIEEAVILLRLAIVEREPSNDVPAVRAAASLPDELCLALARRAAYASAAHDALAALVHSPAAAHTQLQYALASAAAGHAERAIAQLRSWLDRHAATPHAATADVASLHLLMARLLLNDLQRPHDATEQARAALRIALRHAPPSPLFKPSPSKSTSTVANQNTTSTSSPINDNNNNNIQDADNIDETNADADDDDEDEDDNNDEETDVSDNDPDADIVDKSDDAKTASNNDDQVNSIESSSRSSHDDNEDDDDNDKDANSSASDDNNKDSVDDDNDNKDKNAKHNDSASTSTSTTSSSSSSSPAQTAAERRAAAAQRAAPQPRKHTTSGGAVAWRSMVAQRIAASASLMLGVASAACARDERGGARRRHLAAEARRALRRSLRLEPASGRVAFAMALTLADSRQIAPAMRCARAAVALQPHAAAWNLLALLLSAQQQYKRALAVVDAGLLQSDDVDLLRTRAQLLRASGDSSGAVRALARALDTQRRAALARLSTACAANGAGGDGRSESEPSILSGRTLGDGGLTTGEAASLRAQSLSNVDLRVTSSGSVLDDGATSVYSAGAAASWRASSSRHAGANNASRTAAHRRLDASLLALWLDLALLFGDAGRLDDADACVDQADAHQPLSPDVLSVRARLAEWRNHPDQAAHLYEQALAINPDHVDTLRRSGRFLLERELQVLNARDNDKTHSKFANKHHHHHHHHTQHNNEENAIDRSTPLDSSANRAANVVGNATDDVVLSSTLLSSESAPFAATSGTTSAPLDLGQPQSELSQRLGRDRLLLAEQRLRRAVREDPVDEEAWLLLGRVLMAKNDYHRATECFFTQVELQNTTPVRSFTSIEHLF